MIPKWLPQLCPQDNRHSHRFYLYVLHICWLLSILNFCSARYCSNHFRTPICIVAEFPIEINSEQTKNGKSTTANFYHLYHATHTNEQNDEIRSLCLKKCGAGKKNTHTHISGELFMRNAFWHTSSSTRLEENCLSDFCSLIWLAYARINISFYFPPFHTPPPPAKYASRSRAAREYELFWQECFE